MDQQKIVIRETAIVAIGEILLSAIMVGIFAALGYFKGNVLFGALAGCVVMIANYFFMAMAVCLAADRAEQGDVEQGKRMIRRSSVIRLVVMGMVLIAIIKLEANALALLLPLTFARPILLLAEFFRKKGDT